MKKVLSLVKSELYYYQNGEKVECANPEMLGNCTGLRGNCSGLYGNCSGLYGNCTDLYGDLDDAKISDDERKNGVNIMDLVKE